MALNIFLSCGDCQEGMPQLCTAFNWIVVGSPGFSDSIVMPASAAVPVPNGVSLRQATLAEPLSVSVHAIKRSNRDVGDVVGVFGAGQIRLGIIDAAQTVGAGKILVSELYSAWRDTAVELGIDIVIDPCETDSIGHFKDETDRGVDVSFEVA